MAQHVVLIYTTPSCVYCRMAKDFFTEHGVIYQEFNVLEDMARREEMERKSHQLGVPVIDVDGEIFAGFNRSELMRALDIQDHQ